MPRTTVTMQQVVIDPVQSMADTGEFTKLGRFLGYDVSVRPTQVENFQGSRIELNLNHECFTAEALAGLAAIVAVSLDRSGQQALDDIKRQLEKMEFPLDRPLGDVMEIGGGEQHDGHRHREA